MHVLLTGSSGWLGRFLAPRLRAAGHFVTGLDVAVGPDTDVVGSVADRAVVDAAFARGVDAVVHGGALHKPDIARYPRQTFVDVNVTGTLNLLEAAVAAGCARFVFTSTTSLMISHAIRAGEADTAALERAPEVGFGTYIVSAPTPFARADAANLKHDARAVIARYFPDAEALYAARGWTLPAMIDRVYDAALIGRDLGFRCATDFAAVLQAIRTGQVSPVVHDAHYLSPKERVTSG